MKLDTKLDYVELYKKLGFNLIPLYAGTKRPSIDWQRFQKERANESMLVGWFDMYGYDMAVVCGSISDNLVVIDCDNQETFEIIAKNLDAEGKTLINKTPHGWHIYTRCATITRPHHYRTDKIGLDILGEGSIAVLPPSTFESAVYKIDSSTNLDDIRLIKLDDVIRRVENALSSSGVDLKKATFSHDGGGLGVEGYIELLENLKEGNREVSMFRAVNRLKQTTSMTEVEMLTTLSPHFLKVNWKDGEIREALHKAFMYHIDDSRRFELEHPQPKMMVTADKLDADVVHRETLIENVLHRCDVLLLYAPSGEGKSIFATNICGALINGTRALEMWTTKQSRVGFADYEMPLDELQERMLTIFGNTLGFKNFRAQSYQGRRLVDRTHIEELEANIREFKLDVLVIDNLSSASGCIKDENTATMRECMDIIRGVAMRNNCAIIVVHHTGKPKFDNDGNLVRMTPRGHSSISDAVEIELQVLTTERENIRSLLCTKSRRVHGIRKGWQRDFFYDPDAFTITPIDEKDELKQTTIVRLKTIKEALSMSDRDLGKMIDVNFSTIARWFRDEMLPTEMRLIKVRETLVELETQLGVKNATQNATERNTTKPSIIKNSASKKTTKSVASESKTVVLTVDNACQKCSAYNEKASRFVDGESNCENGIMFVAQCPGEVEMKSTPRRPLIGPAGKEFDTLCHLAYIERDKCRITNLVKCGHIKPPDPTAKEIKCCSIHLQAEIDKYKPKLIISMGVYAWNFFAVNAPISISHGKLFTKELTGKSYELLPMYHPSAILHNPTLRKTLNSDFSSIHFKDTPKVLPPATKSKKAASFKSSSITALDFETESLDCHSTILSASYSDSPNEATVVLGAPKEIKLKHIIDQNMKFELKSIKVHAIKLECERIDDPYLLAKVLCRERAGLKDLAMSELNVLMTRFEEVAKNSTLVGIDEQALINYTGPDADMARQVWFKLEKEAKTEYPKLWQIYDEIERHIPPILVDMELQGIRIDTKYLEKVGKELDTQMQELAKTCEKKYVLTETIINSPKQLGEYLKSRGCDIYKKTSTGQLSTEADVLEALAPKHPEIQAVLDYRKPAKLKNTYVDGWLKLIDDNGYVYPEYTQIINSGRFSSNEPNAQNLPVGDKIRHAIIAPKGKKLAAFDFSQMHLVIIAWLAKDEEMLEVFRKGGDIHASKAIELFGSVDKEKRNIAKHINHAITKGVSAERIARDTGITQQEAEDFMKRWFEGAPKVKKYLDEAKERAKSQGYMESMYGRRRYSDKVYASDWGTKESGVRELVDMLMQGSEADIVKKAMIATYKLAPMYMQVHDELVFVVEPSAKELLDELKKKMLAVTEVPLKIDVKVGDNLGEL